MKARLVPSKQAVIALQDENATTMAQNIRSFERSALLGRILVNNKLISQAQLTSALTAQDHDHKQLGELLLEQHLISGEQLEQALREQYWRRKGHWVI